MLREGGALAMDAAGAARVLHVLGVVLWIGGLSFVTCALLPALRGASAPQEALRAFERVERVFAWQARVATLVVGASGFYLVERFGLWGRFAAPEFWWMHAMVAVWALFTLMLFVLEPLVLHRWFAARVARAPQSTLRLVSGVHWVLALLSLATVAGAVAGSHGALLSFAP